MARLILMYEMQSAAVKSAPWRGHLIGCSLLMPKNIWAVDDGSTLTRRLIAPREAQPRRRLQQRLGTDDYQCSLFLSQQSISSSCWKIDTAALTMPTTHGGNYAQILVHHQTHLDAKDALLIPLPSFPISWCAWRYKKQKEEIVRCII